MATEDSGPLSRDKGHRYQIIAESHRVPMGRRPSGLSVHPPPCGVRPLRCRKLTGHARGHTGGQRWGCQDPVPALQRQNCFLGLSRGAWSPMETGVLVGSEPILAPHRKPLAPLASLLSTPSALHTASRRDRRKVSPLPGELAVVLAT